MIRAHHHPPLVSQTVTRARLMDPGEQTKMIPLGEQGHREVEDRRKAEVHLETEKNREVEDHLRVVREMDQLEDINIPTTGTMGTLVQGSEVTAEGDT
mmetsp:Transcript_38731/g.96092  ORF Transcript_38731/g.96092 Transcript_38731/m.96092 type:complete len:98 (+) Transcript_38731:485-778(+)